MAISQEPSNQVNTLGYSFDQRPRSSSPGYLQLTILLRPEPSNGMFDPELVRVSVCSAGQGFQYLTIRYGFERGAPCQVCADRIIIRDRAGHLIQAFSFGGSLAITQHALGTLCYVEQPGKPLNIPLTSQVI